MDQTLSRLPPAAALQPPAISHYALKSTGSGNLYQHRERFQLADLRGSGGKQKSSQKVAGLVCHDSYHPWDWFLWPLYSDEF